MYVQLALLSMSVPVSKQDIGKGLVYGTNFTNSTEDRADLLRPDPSPLPLGQVGQSGVVDEFLNKKRNGFFIEAGAWDGEYLSNTLFFERNRD